MGGDRMNEIWQAVKADLKNHISPSGYALWLDPLKVAAGPDGELQLLCPNLFALRWVQSHYMPLIHQVLTNLGAPLDVKLLVTRAGGRPQLPAAAQAQPVQPQLPGTKSNSRKINRNFIFERFVVGSSNRLAFQASQALARNDTDVALAR